MFRSFPHRLAPLARPFQFIARLDWFALYIVTAAVLLFAIYPLLFFEPTSRHWPFRVSKTLPLGDELTLILCLEAFLLVWLWLEMPRRRKAETALKRLHSAQRAISSASGRIASLGSDELEPGLQRELRAMREMLNVDQIFWFQQGRDGITYERVQTSQGSEELRSANEFSLSHTPWIADAILSGAPVRLRRLEDLPAEAVADGKALQACGVEALALLPSSDGINALALASFTHEIAWDEEVIAQLSVVASVFASAHGKKAAVDAGKASELKFRHLFEDSPLGIALLDPDGQILMSNEPLAKLLGYSREELKLKSITDVAHPEEVAQTWLQMQEVIVRARGTTQTEKRFLRRNGSVLWGKMTLSLAGAEAEDGPYLLAMIEDVTETNLAREQLDRFTRLLTLALEASRTTVWEYDPLTGMISWLDRNKLRAAGDQEPATDLFSNVLSQVFPEDRDKLRGYAETILQTGGAFSTEFRVIARDGRTRWMLVKGESLRRAREESPRILGVTVDVSEVKRAQFQLEQLAKRLMEAQEEERKRISRELHDDIGQRVALLAIELDIVRQKLAGEGELRERIELLQASTSELGTDLHLLSHALHSSKLKHLGLNAALRELCGRIGNSQGLAIELNCADEANLVMEDEALVLYRVAQEALNNVLRHSKASKASIALEYSESHAKLTISDNGHGFNPAASSDGIGLVGMRERVRAVRGEFRVLSAPESGTEIHASVPLRACAKEPIARRAATGSRP
ncbi:MAG TPA: PAS domain S-box protein [Candidatus Bathyarchaeia archaeon]|nr:PAS domain S-box protein [Candidatus Bathyarchaeia archaeon]